MGGDEEREKERKIEREGEGERERNVLNWHPQACSYSSYVVPLGFEQYYAPSFPYIISTLYFVLLYLCFSPSFLFLSIRSSLKYLLSFVYLHIFFFPSLIDVFPYLFPSCFYPSVLFFRFLFLLSLNLSVFTFSFLLLTLPSIGHVLQKVFLNESW